MTNKSILWLLRFCFGFGIAGLAVSLVTKQFEPYIISIILIGLGALEKVIE